MRSYLLVCTALLLAGCSFGPKVPVKVPGTSRIAVNSPVVVADTMGQFFAAQKLVASKAEAKTLISLSTAKALESMVPGEFRVFVDSDVDLQAVLRYDSAKPWAQALGDALLEADVEMAADLERKVMSLRTAKLTAAQAISKYVPQEYSVFADDAVNTGVLVSYDRREPWSEAIGKALEGAGIHSTTNFNQKLVVLHVSPSGIPPRLSAANSTSQTKKNN